MTKSKIIAVVLASVFVLTCVGGLYAWLSGGSFRKVAALQEQLRNAGDMPQAERDALKLELMRTMDEMDRDKVRELYTQIRQEREVRQQEEASAFHNASGEERTQLLDAALARWSNEREVMGALRTDGMRRRGRRGRGQRQGQRQRQGQAQGQAQGPEQRRNRNEQGNRQQGNRQQGEQQQQDRRRGNQQRDDRQQDNRQELSDEEKAAKKEARQLRTEYYSALKARAEELGIERPRGGRR